MWISRNMRQTISGNVEKCNWLIRKRFSGNDGRQEYSAAAVDDIELDGNPQHLPRIDLVGIAQHRPVCLENPVVLVSVAVKLPGNF